MKENNILISILVPTYNRVKYLGECLDSIVEQKWFKKEEIEILIGDNSEWDETKEFMESYLKDHQKYEIIYIKNKTNLWWIWNFNNLLDESRWEYYIILSDDDKFYDKNSLKNIYDWLLKYKLDVCYWKYKVFNSDWSKTREYRPHEKIKNKKLYIDTFDDQILWHTMTFGGVLYRQLGYRYDKASKWMCDRNMNLQYLYHKKRVWMINNYTFLYRVHDTNDTYTIPKVFFWKFVLYSYNFFNIPIFKRVFYFIKMIIRAILRRIRRFIEDHF